MRLSDAGLRRHRTKLIYPNHRPAPWLTQDATPRSLEPIVRHPRNIALSALAHSEEHFESNVHREQQNTVGDCAQTARG